MALAEDEGLVASSAVKFPVTRQPAKEALAAEVDARPLIPASEQVPYRTVVVPELGAEYVAYETATPAPVGPCSRGSERSAEVVKPRRESPERWDDSSAFWRCPTYGTHRDDVAV